MSEKTELASEVTAPSGDASAPRQTQRLANTGTTESVNATALTSNAMATLMVGNTAIRINFRGTGALSTQVATTDMIIGANQRFDWYALPNNSTFVYVEAADAASAYEAWVWTSSP